MYYRNSDIQIEDVQSVELEILLEFDRICRANKIPYQLFAGTLLGAVRHKGFIPWDDDIDVCLKRVDYDRFIRCCSESLDRKFFLQTCFTDRASIVQFAKLRKNGTVFENDVDCLPTSHTGIYIDIFPMDNVRPGTFAEGYQQFMFKLLYAISTSSVKARVKNSKSKVKRLFRYIFYYILKIIPKSAVDRWLQSVIKMFDKNETEYINHLTNGITKKRFNRYLRRADTFYDIVELEFCGHNFPAPANYNDVLRLNFGDYMKLPPEDEQCPHHGITKIELGEKYGKV